MQWVSPFFHVIQAHAQWPNCKQSPHHPTLPMYIPNCKECFGDKMVTLSKDGHDSSWPASSKMSRVSLDVGRVMDIRGDEECGKGTTSGTLLLLLLLLIQHSRRQASHQSQFFITNTRHCLSPSTKSFLKIQLDPCATHPYKSQELYWHLLKVWRWKAIPRSTLAPTWVRTCTAMLGFFLQRFVSSFRSSNNSLLVTGPRLLSNRDSKEYMYRRWAS